MKQNKWGTDELSDDSEENTFDNDMSKKDRVPDEDADLENSSVLAFD